MKKPETKFRESTYKDLNSLENCFWESIQQKTIKGSCDLIMCLNGKYIGIEYKKDANTEPMKYQQYKHKKIKKANGIVFIAYPENWKKIMQKLRYLSTR